MNIYSIYYTHKPGGFCKRLYRLLNALADGGHQVTYLSLDTPTSHLSTRVEFRKIPFPLKGRTGITFWAIFSLWASIFTFWISAGKSVRWVVFSPFYSSLLSPSAILFGAPIVCFVRSKLAANSESYFLSAIEKISHRICFKVTDKVIVQTKANAQIAETLGLPNYKISVLANNIDRITVNQNTRTYSQPLEILTTGVFTPKKNLSFLFQVWKILEEISVNENLPCPKLTIKGVIRDNNLQLPISNKVCLSPWANDLDDTYQLFQIYLHPSQHEGMPNSVLEAMGHGLIALVANTPELEELVADKRLCFDLSQPKDLANKILELQADSEKLSLLQKLSRQRAEQLCFNWDAAAAFQAVN